MLPGRLRVKVLETTLLKTLLPSAFCCCCLNYRFISCQVWLSLDKYGRTFLMVLGCVTDMQG